jgi:RNA polymerase sigma-70 factor (ECF subfamily)
MAETTDDIDERALIQAAQANPARFVDLYDRYFHRVYAYVIRRTRSREEAEDITSTVFERALAHLPKFEWRGTPFVAWLFRIAANAISDRRQSLARHEHESPAAADPFETEDIERRAMIFELVERLPDLQRQVIELRFVEEKSIREIAAALNRSEGAVKQLQLRALENLRKDMEGRHG